MTDQAHNGEKVAWTEQELAEIEEIASRYPSRRSAMLPVLWMAQHKFGWLSLPVLELVAETVGVPPSEARAVASFYTMLKKKPTGRYVLQVCHTLSCALNGAEEIIRHIESKYDFDENGNTPDGLFTLERVECLASCGSGPMMQVGEHYYERLTPEKVDEILAGFESGEPLPTPRPEADEWQWNLQS